MRAASQQGHRAPTTAAAAAAHGRGDTDPAAAFAAIKAAIHSSPDVPGFFTAAQPSESRRGVVGGKHAGRRDGCAAGSGVPAAAQASWASTDDAEGAAGTDDSDEGSGSWATVDELEQQANMNEQHGKRTTTESQYVNSSSTAEERAASPVSCEGSMSAAAGLGRLPAEVMFSPMKSTAPCSVQSE